MVTSFIQLLKTFLGYFFHTVTEKLKLSLCMVTEKLTWSFKWFSGCGEEEENSPLVLSSLSNQYNSHKQCNSLN